MPEATRTVVRNVEALTEDEFHAVTAQAVARMVKIHGKARVAQWMEISVRQLGNIMAGSTPGARSLFNLLAHDTSAHDELDAEYGLKNVDKDATCSTDPLTVIFIRLLPAIADAEDPESAGGCAVVDSELRAMDETLIRKINRITGGWVDRLDAMHRPSGLRSVG